MPNSKLLLQLMDKVGPLASSSANISGKDPIESIDEAKKVFSDKANELALVEDKNFNISHAPSTIIDLDKFVVLRTGAIDGQKILDQIKKGSK